ncbi:MAG: hypothetical protein WCI18_09445 [Pseudomonadota bacterium]
MSKRIFSSLVLIPLSLLLSCKAAHEKWDSDLQSSMNGTKKTACLSFQGNGTYFSSHIGALIALLESNYEPTFVTGGSSGAIIANIARALVENKSLAVKGEFAPQMAARLLASSSGIIDSVLFLPRFTNPLILLDSFDVFISGTSQGVLFGDPKDGMVNAESIVGQSALVIDFFKTADFSEALKQSTIVEREATISKLWMSYSNSVLVTPNDAADAILTDKAALAAQGRNDLVIIQDRFFKMFRSKLDTSFRNYKTQQEEWNTFLAGNSARFGLENPIKRRTIFKAFLGKLKSIESFDAIYASFSGNFLLMDPDLVWGAFHGFDPVGKRMEIPSNVIIHSTARRGQKTDGDFKEQRGLASLHQVYFTNQNMAERVRRTLYAPESNPLKPSSPEFPAALPSERIVVSSSLLGPALAATTGEPTAFTRYEIELDPEAQKRLPWLSSSDALIGYGGWLEKNSLGTGRKFAECAPDKVDTYMASGDGAKVTNFAKMAYFGLLLESPLRGLLARQVNNPSDLRAFITGRAKQNQMFTSGPEVDEIEKTASIVGQIFDESVSAKGRLGNIPLNFNHVAPSSSNGPKSADANMAFRSNRRAMVLGAYEFTRNLITHSGSRVPELNLFGIPSKSLSILSQGSDDEVMVTVNSAIPRP